MAIEEAQSRRESDSPQAARELERCKDLERHKQEVKNALLGQQVLHDLGKPRDLLQVQVRPVWECTYRVNVFVGVNTAAARIGHSFFIVTDGDGNVLESTPKVRRQY